VCTTDRRRLERVLVNLLENAAVHGGGATLVRVDRERAAVVRISVEDTGPGVPLEDRERIFERFARLRQSRRGTGLGLAIVSEHVRAINGRVWAEEGPGGSGARFVVELPVERAPLVAAESLR